MDLAEAHAGETKAVDATRKSSLDEAALDAVMLMHRHVFMQQLTMFSELSGKVTLSEGDIDASIPELLLKRAAANEEMIRKDVSGESYGIHGLKGRLLFNEEIALLDILDADGNISTLPRLSGLVLLMNRFNRLEGRLLCLHILSKRTFANCAAAFVKYSGYRLLRRWLKAAEEEGRLEEIRLIVSVCRTLPFEANAVRDSEIGKAIKKLLKYRPPASTSNNYHNGNGNASVDSQLGMLIDEVKKLMKYWTDEINKAASESQDTKEKDSLSLDSTKIPAFVLSLAERHDNTQAKDSDVNTKNDSSSKHPTKITSASTDQKSEIAVSMQGKAVATNAVPSTMAAKMMLSNSQGKMATAATVTIQPSTTAVKPTIQSTTQASSLNNLSWLTSTAAEVKAATESAQNAARLSAAVPRERKNDAMIEEAKRQLALRESMPSTPSVPSSTVPNAGLIPGPSVLKRKADNQAQPPRKRAKMSIQWADDSGGTLREVFTFEVEKIRSTVSGYKSHKDLVKKEKQLEKDAHNMKIHDAMSRTIDWKEPGLLSLSIDILDTINAPVNSLEKAIQEKRIAHMLETRFLDESLIPNDPDIIASAYTNDPSAPSIDAVATIPWQLPNEHIIVDNPMIVNSDVNFMSHQASSSFNALPDSLRSLDPSVLAFLASNEAYVAYLLREDGSIDESRLRALQANILGENHVTFQPYQPQFVPSNYSGVMAHPSTSWNSMQSQGPIPPTVGSFGNPSYQTFSVPTVNQLTGASTLTTQTFQPSMVVPAVNILLPTQKDLVPKKGAKGSVACRMFNTPEGCRFGDRCDFAHIGISGIDILRPGSIPGHRITSPAMAKNRVGPDGQNRRGPGGR